MRRDSFESKEIVTLQGEDELSAALYSYAVLGEAPRRVCTREQRERAKILGSVVGRVGITPDFPRGDLSLKLSESDFALLAGAANYLLSSRSPRLRKLRQGASCELLDAAQKFADSRVDAQ